MHVICLSVNKRNIPAVNVAFIITYSDCNISHFADIKMRVVLVIVRCDPAHPHATGLLSRKHSHRVVILVKEKGSGWIETLVRVQQCWQTSSMWKITNLSYSHTVVVLRIMSTSSLSSGTTSSIKRGMVGTIGGGDISAAFLALKRNLQITAAVGHNKSKSK